MARKKDLADKLNQGAQESRPGWRETITTGQEPVEVREPVQEEEEESSPLKRKTYLLTPALIEQIAELAGEERVGINELVRFLLQAALEQVAADELTIPTRPGTRRIVP